MRSLLGLTGAPDVQTANAAFYQHVPHVAPYAYLHIIFSPPTPHDLEESAQALSIPGLWRRWLETQNGADIFSGALAFYGVVPRNQLLSRGGPYAQSPYSIVDVNEELVLRRYPQWVQIAGYGVNLARLLINRSDQSLMLVDRRGEKTLYMWSDIESFLTTEPKRLAMLYGPTGKLLVDYSLTVPNA